MKRFKLLPEDNVRDRVISNQDFQRLLFAAEIHLKPILITAWETGMRKSEILNLEWIQVYLKQGIIHLYGEDCFVAACAKLAKALLTFCSAFSHP